MASVRNLAVLHDRFSTTAPSEDLSEMLRAELVLAVSALDCFLHDLIRLGTLDIYNGLKSMNSSMLKPDKFKTENIFHTLTLDKAAQIAIIDVEIKRINSTKTYQNPDIIQDNIRVLGVTDIWDRVGRDLTMTPNDVKAQLELIIDRRNKIAHEADIDDSSGMIGIKRDIFKVNVDGDIDFIERVCESIYNNCI